MGRERWTTRQTVEECTIQLSAENALAVDCLASAPAIQALFAGIPRRTALRWATQFRDSASRPGRVGDLLSSPSAHLRWLSANGKRPNPAGHNYSPSLWGQAILVSLRVRKAIRAVVPATRRDAVPLPPLLRSDLSEHTGAQHPPWTAATDYRTIREGCSKADGAEGERFAPGSSCSPVENMTMMRAGRTRPATCPATRCGDALSPFSVAGGRRGDCLLLWYPLWSAVHLEQPERVGGAVQPSAAEPAHNLSGPGPRLRVDTFFGHERASGRIRWECYS